MNKIIMYVGILVFFSASLHAMDNYYSLGKQLVAAVTADNQEKVKRLLDAKAPITFVEDRFCSSALVEAARKGHSECVRMLIDAKASLDFQDDYQRTALMYAAKYDNLECMRTLIEAKASVDYQNCWGTALTYGVENGNLKCVRMLIDAKASVAYVPFYRQSALICAARYGRLECIRLLIDAGAGVNLRDGNGLSILQYRSEEFLPYYLEEILRIPNKKQKKKICLFLGCLKKQGMFGEMYRLRNWMFKFILQEKISEQNKENFKQSIAYREVAKLGDGPAKAALLEKFDRKEKTKSGCAIQ